MKTQNTTGRIDLTTRLTNNTGTIFTKINEDSQFYYPLLFSTTMVDIQHPLKLMYDMRNGTK